MNNSKFLMLFDKYHECESRDINFDANSKKNLMS